MDILFAVFYFSLLYLTVFLMLTLFESGETRFHFYPRKFAVWPMVSVIVPAFNEAHTISKVVRSALNMDYPKNKLEVIVVNDGSTDNTESVVRKIRDKRIKILKQNRKGKGAALNFALDRAKGEFVACLDADSYVSRNSLKEMLVNFSEKNISAVTPIMKVDKPRTTLQKVQKVEYLLAVYVKRILSHINAINVTPGPFSVYRTDVLRKIGKFDESSIVEDQEIAYRMQKYNYRIVQSDRGDVYTVAPKSLRDLYYQRKRWCKGSWLTFNKYRSIMLDRRYGDFGYFLMPNVLFGLLSCFFMTIFFGIYVFLPALQVLRHIYIAGFYFNIGSFFNVSEFVSNFVFFTDFYKLFVIWAFAAITLFILVRSHKTTSERMSFTEAIPMAVFIFVYYIFLSFIYIISTIDLVLKDKHDW
ncbi:MAG: glycosyltransferase family 2 protein [Candidatus Aenigmatarchaeota archaeon]